MNKQRQINNLLTALSKKGQLYKINTFQTYIEEENRFIKKYQVFKRQPVEVYDTEEEDFKIINKFLKDKESYSIIEILKYFVEEYRKQGDDNNGIQQTDGEATTIH